MARAEQAGSLAQDPIERRQEAGSLWWAETAVGFREPCSAEEALDHHDKVTPVHEAGRAVAATLAGRQVKRVRVRNPYLSWGRDDVAGLVSCDAWPYLPRRAGVPQLADDAGLNDVLADLVIPTPGPLLKFDMTPGSLLTASAAMMRAPRARRSGCNSTSARTDMKFDRGRGRKPAA